MLLNSQVTIEDVDSIDDKIIVHEEIDNDWEEKLLKNTLIKIDENYKENKESTDMHSRFEDIDVNDIYPSCSVMEALNSIDKLKQF